VIDERPSRAKNGTLHFEPASGDEVKWRECARFHHGGAGSGTALHGTALDCTGDERVYFGLNMGRDNHGDDLPGRLHISV
jgi:hypothetical protein